MNKKRNLFLAGIVICAVCTSILTVIRTTCTEATTIDADPVNLISLDEEDQGNETSGPDGMPETVPEEMIVTTGAITGLQIEARNVRQLVVSWDPCEQADYYEIYRREKKTGTEYTKIAETDQTEYIDKKIQKNTNYVYKLVAIYDINEEAVFGQTAKITYNYKEHIPVVSHLKTDARADKAVEIFWDDNPATDQYEIYRKDVKNKKYVRLGTTRKNSYIDRTVAFGKKYYYKVVPVRIGDEYTFSGTADTIVFHHVEFVNTKHQYYTYNEMKKDLKQLEQKYARHCRVDIVGSSVQKRNIYDVVVGNPDAPESLLVVSTLHAREYIASMLCMEQIEYYLRHYNHTIDGKKVSDVLDHVNIHYIVMTNPDGVMISQTKNRYLKNNANNVNLNANYPYQFVASPTSGSKAASEPETQAILSVCKKLKKEKKLQAIFNYHAMGQIVFGRYSGSNGYIKNMTTKMYWVARNTTGYADQGGYGSGSSKSSGGGFREYALYSLKVPSITVEIGSVSCPVPYSYMPTIFRQNKYVILREAALFL